ncbi:cysteine-rich CWC family protein [Pseudomonas sp. 5P_3.1_Bac2]|uniref:cysteine-rich CWC family protein n=1 Tax=Pseudomonas sp. 5P_3.1_Bac2 TaxID=2971617 RepID=UPI0021C76074|nr:cysteine-rich CWC family protein [Pseudomonas sp. 5P_3.1_Bac2]MCU1715904.1 cysteine-rich CWC family protein [Pseudomonas sp. 5P_3.1_Bac2]
MPESATRCPRCGQRNQCAQADSSTPVSACWCFSLMIDPAVLSDLPRAPAEQSCLCPACAQALTATDSPD